MVDELAGSTAFRQHSRLLSQASDLWLKGVHVCIAALVH
jgi:hypothetical protein